MVILKSSEYFSFLETSQKSYECCVLCDKNQGPKVLRFFFPQILGRPVQDRGNCYLKNHWITESIWLGGGKVGHLIQPSCWRRAILEHRIVILEYLQWERLSNLSGQSVSVLSHPHSQGLSHILVDISVHQFLLSASCPIAWHPSFNLDAPLDQLQELQVSCTEEPELGTAPQMWLTRVSEGAGSPPSNCWQWFS